jgi:enamine deaminase RidA (YjgF/YER057c/UK114 family)
MITRITKTPILHRAVVHGGVAYLGGMVADDRSLDMKGQTAQICAKLDAVLASAGTDKTKLLSAQIFVTRMSEKKGMDEAWLEWLDGADLPARATVGVAELGGPTTLVEIVVTAAV